jgi:hypothetical protein
MRSAAATNATEQATMVDSFVEKAKAPEQQDNDQTMEEFHDATAVHTGETSTLMGAKWKEIHLLLEITYNNHTEARTSPQKHMLMHPAWHLTTPNWRSTITRI